MIQLEVHGIPTPWAAHQGYGKRSYNPKQQKREQVQWQIRPQLSFKEPLAGPIRIAFTYHMPIPVNTSGIRKAQMLNGRIHHISRPDLDNLNKFMCDAIKGIVIADDSQVVEIVARKIFSEKPKTLIQLQVMND